jgi:hypothetical protein
MAYGLKPVTYYTLSPKTYTLAPPKPANIS